MSPSDVGRQALSTPAQARTRPVWAEIDLGAVRHNASLLSAVAAPGALCAVVKADGYGHGAIAVARAALEGGATWLAVATPDEGIQLLEAGILAPVLVLAEPPAEAMADVVGRGLTLALYSLLGAEAAGAASTRAGAVTDVHVKVDTGMHRVGAAPAELLEIVRAVVAQPSLRFAALWTHFPVADGIDAEDRAFTEGQIRSLGEARDLLARAGLAPPMVHAANSAGALGYPTARLDMARCGIALYGVPPFPMVDAAVTQVMEVTGARALRPVLSLRAKVTLLRRLDAYERPSYGRLYGLPAASTVATVPLGYADGVPRRYFTLGGTVLVGGRRRPLAGMVTMDQIVVDCGPDDDVAVGDDVVLIGEQGSESLTAPEWAEMLGTISHEVFCGIGPRVPRVVVDREAPR
ncbi:MAG TPA: alanine racemase [Acidimicrobiales bacterium]|nr:alanine racemase [Acidimicrobiales bacterium]